ncbi:uncharacterized protein LOC100890470 isoform X2 [Strongylocentrotus purpuratus]|uniref:Protein kinase domain-containing protein n=1 Tax=Strongylocentrotus purpuratus TaxID=7668 RepID=A0A7M7HDI9_STRPU|nr:uncharacterized protein LOC100890470 isoform X2 [Strongylocentrotus purpuratus]|eukprot:XP_011665854.1 PREDICTED: uncharacterized protein LOC100890470 isoform X2 [Strongylocentrotus purpuratus]
MSLVRDLLDDLLPSGLMENHSLFKKTTVPSPQAWPKPESDVNRMSAYYNRIKEYCRQVFTISQSNGQDNKDGQPSQKELRRKILAETKIALGLARDDALRKTTERRGKKIVENFFDVRKNTVKLENRLREERKRSGVLRRKWEREFNRANKFEREKREAEKKIKKMSDMLVRMKEMLVTLEDENSKYKNDLDDVLLKLEEKEEDAEFLDVSVHEATKAKEKLEKELSRLLKDTADSEFKDLNEIHFALLRKTTPIANVNITEKYEPIVDENKSIITLGGGAFGRVFAYRQKRGRQGKTVAMKILHSNADDYEVRRQEIILEARLIRLFAGTGVFPRTYGVGSLGNDTAIAMEFLGDDSTYKVKTLNTWTHEEHVSIHHAKTVLLDVLSALKALHSMDILHNDIKGDNVIVKQSDHDLFSGYLIDLGNASTTFLSAIYDFGQTERDYYDDDPLSIHYAPELIFDNAATTRASDVYQIGQLIYIMGNDMGNEDLRDIGERCVYREPLSRIRLLDLIELVSQL